MHMLNEYKADLCLIDAESFHDLVYSGPILDGNKDVPPYTVPVTTARLKFVDGVRDMRGLGVLPHKRCFYALLGLCWAARKYSSWMSGFISYLLDGKEV